MAEQRLIDANVLKMDLPTETTEDECVTEAVCKIIDKQPTVDAEPVRHGRWVCGKAILNRQTCSCCGCYFDMLEVDNYCPNCGAKMDEVSE